MFRMIGLLALVSAGVWLARRVITPSGSPGLPGTTPYEFNILFAGGQVAKVKGVVPRNVYNGFEDVAALARTDGTVSMDRSGELTFSERIPEQVQQQFRNVYVAGRLS